MQTTRMTWVAVSLWLASGCGGGKKTTATPPHPPAADVGEGATAPPAAARKLTQEETLTSASGATLTVAAGWSVAEAAGLLTMTEPDGELTITYLEVEGDGGRQAIDAAWKRARAGFTLEVAQADDLPGRDGWDAATQIVYVTPTAGQRLVIAVALGKGKTWRVFLVDGKQAALGRRGAQLGTTIDSLKAPGVTRESWAGKKANALDAKRLAELDAFVEQSMKADDIPGAAIAIVQDGKVVLERGYGVRELGKKAKVGPHTLFLTGSTGKSLMTLMMARAVDAGVFGWDTPVTKLLPSFALGDAEVTKALLVHHTVCACTGMPRQDLEMIFEYKDMTPELRIDSMKTMVPTTKFGETFQYSNLLVAAGGYAAGQALFPKLGLGAAFDQAMQKQVFEPLKMKDTTYDFKRAAKADHATPHASDLAGTMTAFSIEQEIWVSPVRPAGGQWSSVHDYARVLLLELGKGELDGKRLVSEANLLERRKPQVKLNDELSYGMGLMVGTTHDVPVVQHGGGTAGFTTDYFWLPEYGVGAIIVANVGGGNNFVGAVDRRIFEILFDAEPRAEKDLAEGIGLRKQEIARQLEMLKKDIDKAWVEPLLGVWVAPGLGRIELRMDKDKPVLDAGEWRATLGEKTAKDGTRGLVATSAPFAGFDLVPEDRDGKRVLVVRDSQHEYVFVREAK